MSGWGFWLSLGLLGAYHGINPAMGWLFAVALGFQEQRARAVWWALFPIALGHAIAIGGVVLAVLLLEVQIPLQTLRWTGALILATFGTYRLIRTRHPRWVGMRVRFHDLVVWSAIMATAHGAGLMLIPWLIGPHVHRASAYAGIHTTSGHMGLGVVAVHTLGYFLTMGIVAWVVYTRVGVAVLRRMWINFDTLWALVLIAAGVVTVIL